MEETIKVGLAGYGMAGEFFHAPLLHVAKGLQLHTVMERHKERSKERYPHVKIVSRYEDMVEDPALGLIVIATPNDTHFDYAKRALLADKHVVVDKPFTVHAREAEELISLAQRKGKLLTVFQNRRWDGDFLTVQKLIQQGTLGRILEYRAHYDRYRPQVDISKWKESTGVFYDLGPHLIDQALVLFGIPPHVSTQVQKQRENAHVEDYFEVKLQYGPTEVFLSASMLMENPRPRFQIKGTLGTFTKYGLDPQENKLKAGEWPEGNDWGQDPEQNWGILETSEGTRKIETEKGNYPTYYTNVYEAITQHKKAAVNPETTLVALRIIENGRRAVMSGE